MKTIMYLAATAATVASTPLSIFNYGNPVLNTNLKAKSASWYAPDSIENLIKNVNSNAGDVTWVPVQGIVPTMQKLVQNVYDTYFNDQTGSLYSLKMTPKDEKVVQTFKNDYTNNTPNEQTYYTQSYSETITNTHTFSWKLTEEVSAKASFKVPLVGDTEFSVKVGSEQQTTDSTTTSQTLTNPSQPFKVSPKSLGTALYVIKQGTYHNEGLVRFKVNLDDNIGGSYYWGHTGEWWQAGSTIRELISILNKNGYANQIKNTSTKFSVLSTDNPNNPTTASLNIPVSWDSQGGKLSVTFDETPL